MEVLIWNNLYGVKQELKQTGPCPLSHFKRVHSLLVAAIVPAPHVVINPTSIQSETFHGL